MVFLVSDEVKPKKGGPRMIVTGYSSGMVECRWHDGYSIKREAFREDELQPGDGQHKRDTAKSHNARLCRAFLSQASGIEQ